MPRACSLSLAARRAAFRSRASARRRSRFLDGGGGSGIFNPFHTVYPSHTSACGAVPG